MTNALGLFTVTPPRSSVRLTKPSKSIVATWSTGVPVSDSMVRTTSAASWFS